MLALAFLMPLVIILLFAVGATAADSHNGSKLLAGLGIGSSLLFAVAWIFVLKGLITVEPNFATVLTLLGEYKGTVATAGFWWANPLFKKEKVSLRVRNFNTGKLKVNDLAGNLIEIAAVIVWRVTDTANALFDVDDYTRFANIQSRSAVRHLASAYEPGQDGEKSLRGSMEEVSSTLRVPLQSRLHKVGIEIGEIKLNHLAYAPEIAGAMLRRQQAEAIVAATMKIVQGAVGMVDLALDHLSRSQNVWLDPERCAAMVSNLMGVLCGDHSVQPVVNPKSMYH